MDAPPLAPKISTPGDESDAMRDLKDRFNSLARVEHSLLWRTYIYAVREQDYNHYLAQADDVLQRSDDMFSIVPEIKEAISRMATAAFKQGYVQGQVYSISGREASLQVSETEREETARATEDLMSLIGIGSVREES